MSHGLRTALVAVALASFVACKRRDPWEEGKRVFHMGLRASIASFEPVRAATQSDALVLSAIFQPLLEYQYLVRPLKLKPLLLESMPEVSEDRLTYTLHLRKGVRFHDDPCFAGGVGRELIADDVVQSMKRMADDTLTPSGWWVYNDRIAGFDAFKANKPFDYDAPIEGLEVVDRYTLRIRLTGPYPQLLYVLAMEYTAVVPRDCAAYYGGDLGQHPVGTGPFHLKSWIPGQKIVLERNEKYWEERYPSEASPGTPPELTAPAGRRVPFLDAVVMQMYEQEQPMWLKWRVGDIDFIQTPAEYQPSVFDEEWHLRAPFVKEGVGAFTYEIIDMVYKGFDMEHPITGGGGRGKQVRQAISLALDTDEIGEALYNSAIVQYDGPIPPGLDGHASARISRYRGPDLPRARALLAEAGYPGGKGLPPIEYHTNRTTASTEQVEMLARQLAKIGVRLVGNYHSFPELDAKIKKKQCQMFGLSWTADYPDAENFLALFYGPNASPGSNAFNYSNPEYDRLYERSRLMSPSPERTAIYEHMRDLVIEDAPVIGTFARKRFYLWNRRVKHILPDEVWYGWIRYVDVDPR